MIPAEENELSAQRRAGKSEAAFRTISEVSEDLDVPQHVLRFWESKFPQIKPLKRGGGRRYYRPEDVALLRRIRDLLYKDGYTIKGVQKLLREPAARGQAAVADGEAAPPASAPRSRARAAKPAPEASLPLEADDEPDQLQATFEPELSVDEIGHLEQPEFDLGPRVWIQPEPALSDKPLSALQATAFPSAERAELLAILEELEDLRETLSTSRQGGS